jgi:hypothetical protein
MGLLCLLFISEETLVQKQSKLEEDDADDDDSLKV